MEKFIQTYDLVPVEHDPFAGPAILRSVPTTEAQREIWAAAEMGAAASCAYNESVSLELKGDLDREKLHEALRTICDRHEALHSTIVPGGERYVVKEPGMLPLEEHDLSGSAGAVLDARLTELARKDMSTPFDLIRGPLIRCHLVKLAADHAILRITGHHIICDGWSLGILMAEISQAYSDRVHGRTPDLPVAHPFSEYALAIQRFIGTPDHDRVRDFWKHQFEGPIPFMDLPVDRERPITRSYEGARIDAPLSRELQVQLKETATRSGSSFVTTLLTTFELFLYQLTGDSDLVVGLPAAGQSDLDMKHLVGHCVNLLPLRSRINEELPFIEHLKARRTAVLDAYDHQRYTFGTLLRDLRVARVPGRVPLVPVVFNVDMNMDDGVQFEGLSHRFISNPRSFENFELFLNVTGNEDGLVLEWSYNTDLFTEETIRRWSRQFEQLIERVARHPQALMGDLVGDSPLAGTPAEVPDDWHGRSPSYPRSTSVNALFREVAAQHRDRVALDHLNGELTYSELLSRVNDLAVVLEEAGVGPGDRVGLCSDRCPDMIAAMLAILDRGACFVPLDPSYPKDRLLFMLDDTRPKVLLSQRALRSQLPDPGCAVILLEDVPQASVQARPVPVDATAAAYIMYTSGSTGLPKGVVVPHRAIVRLVRDQSFLPFGPHLVFLQLSNISFDASTLEIWGALLNGARLVLQPQQKPTLLEITETIEQRGVTTVWFTAGLFNLLVDGQLERLRGLHHILTGGDVLSVPHVKKAVSVLGPNVLINGYGPTENTTFTCCHPIGEDPTVHGSVPIGRPIHHTRVYVLDEQRKPVGIGRKGELYAGGDGVALGYWGREDLTAERFMPDPFSDEPGARMYRTGDMVRWLPDGNIEFIGRTDGQVKVRGFRIELGEIENAISELPQVKDRLVMVRQDGPGEKQLVAYVVPENGQVAEDPEQRADLLVQLRSRLRTHLPEHAMPSHFLVLPEFPLNANGKVDRHALPAPEAGQQVLRTRHVAPRDANEKALASIWSRVLGVPDLGVHDNFFDLGGHSLLGIQLLTQVKQEMGYKLPLATLFRSPTIAQLARELGMSEQPKVQLKNLSAIQPQGSKVPIFCVHGDEASYFIPQHLGLDRPFYNFFHQGEDGARILYTEVKDIAEHFLEELRHVRPKGPYVLCGFSFGGLVAFEMAKRLRASGEQVPALVLFDTYEPEEFARVMKREEKFHEPLKRSVLRRIVRWYLKRDKPVPLRFRHFYIIDTYNEATYRYDAGTYEGPLTIFKAEGSAGPGDLGWNRRAQGEIEVVTVPGDHYSMIREPHVETLALELARCIDKGLAKQAVEAV